jgi:hypothetical protein
MTEEAFRQQVRQIARMYGWTMQYHTYSSRRSDAGWPDEVLVHPQRGRVLFVELKTDTGRITAAQQRWLDTLAGCGMETHVWRPRDMDNIVAILGLRQVTQGANEARL